MRRGEAPVDRACSPARSKPCRYPWRRLPPPRKRTRTLVFPSYLTFDPADHMAPRSWRWTSRDSHSLRSRWDDARCVGPSRYKLTLTRLPHEPLLICTAAACRTTTRLPSATSCTSAQAGSEGTDTARSIGSCSWCGHARGRRGRLCAQEWAPVFVARRVHGAAIRHFLSCVPERAGAANWTWPRGRINEAAVVMPASAPGLGGLPDAFFWRWPTTPPFRTLIPSPRPLDSSPCLAPCWLHTLSGLLRESSQGTLLGQSGISNRSGLTHRCKHLLSLLPWLQGTSFHNSIRSSCCQSERCHQGQGRVGQQLGV